MLMPDVNILVYAHRADERFHKPYKQWLEALVGSSQPFGLSALVAVAFVRIVTHPRFAPEPTPLPQALATMEALMAQPRCHILLPGERHLGLVASLCRSAKAKGRMVGDAQHAALAIEHGCTWVSRDDDFARFARHGLRWQRLALEEK